MILSFFPPSQINTGSPLVYVLIIFCGALIFFCVPLIVFSKRKPSWRNPKADFYPFDWQIENRKPDQISKWSADYQPTPADIAGTDARILAEENGATPAEAAKIAAEAAKAYNGSETPQADAYDTLNQAKADNAKADESK